MNGNENDIKEQRDYLFHLNDKQLNGSTATQMIDEESNLNTNNSLKSCKSISKQENRIMGG